MRDVSNSWMISSEFVIEPQGAERLPTLHVLATSVLNSALNSIPRGPREPTSPLGAFAPLTELSPRLSASGALFAYLDSLRRTERLSGAQVAELYDGLAAVVRVPVFGSAPKDWTSLASALTGGLTSGVVVGYDGEPFMVLLAGVSVTLVLNVALPASHAVGRGLEYRILKRMGVPDRFLPDGPTRDDSQTSNAPELPSPERQRSREEGSEE